MKYPHIPRSLDGEILLEEIRVGDVVVGWITVSKETLTNIIAMRDNPSLRPDQTIVFKGSQRSLRALAKDEFEEATGYKKYFDRWRMER